MPNRSVPLAVSALLTSAFAAIELAPAVSAQAVWTTVMADDPANPITRPESRVPGASASDGLNRMYVFGGRSDSAKIDGTFWCYDAVTQVWTQLYGTVANPLPTARKQSAMALDPLRQRIVLFGGNDGGNLDDVWEFDLATQLWFDVTPAVSGPAPRSKHVMAFDLLNVQVVVFGGTDQFTSNTVGDNKLYGWNGTAWSVLDSGTGPSARYDTMMASSGAFGGDIILFGGRKGAGSTETWRWFGTGAGGSWSLVTTATIPGTPGLNDGLNGARMVYDEVRGRYVVFGGDPGETINQRFDGTWEFDGTDWLDRGPSGLTGRRSAAMAYLSGIGKTVMFGGNASQNNRLNDTDDYQTNTLAAVQSIDPGCSLGSLTPVLSIVGAPWKGDTLTISMTGTTGALASAINIGFAVNPINLGMMGLTGCTMQAVPTVSIAVVADPFTLQIPNLPVVPLFMQGMTLQPATGPRLVDLGMTETLDVTVGIR